MDLTDFDLTEKEMVYNNKIFKFLKCTNQKMSRDQIHHPKDHKVLATKNPIFFSPYHLKPTLFFPPSDSSLSQINASFNAPLWHLLPLHLPMLSSPRSFLSCHFRRSSCPSLSRTRGPFSFSLAANCSHLLSSVLSPLLYSPPVTISLPQTLDRVASPDSALSSVTSRDCALPLPYKTLAPLLLSCCLLVVSCVEK
jgi:hypothetical protein